MLCLHSRHNKSLSAILAHLAYDRSAVQKFATGFSADIAAIHRGCKDKYTPNICVFIHPVIEFNNGSQGKL